jgi:hypothetical protein
MKVKSSLKSGNFIDDAAQWVDREAVAVGHFFSNAERQARSLTNSVANWADSAVQSVKNWVIRW